MTDLLPRPILRVRPRAEAPSRPIALAAAVAAGWSAATGLIVMITISASAWFAADTGSFGAAIRVGALAWLVGNGAGLHVGALEVTATPLGSCLVAGWLLYRGGRWAGATSRVSSVRSAAWGASVLAAVYLLVGLGVFALTRSDSAHADLLRTCAATTVIGLLFGGLGIVRGAGLTQRLLRPLPEEARAALTGGLAGLLTMVVASGLVLTATVLVHFSAAVSLAESLHAGLVGGAVMALIGLAAVPNALLCAGAFIAGPGFAVGAATSVTPDSVTLGPLPAIPLLAALPREGGAWWQSALIVIPVLAGGVAGVVSVRRFPVFGYDQAAIRGALSGLVAGAGFGAMTWLGTGGIGPGRMQHIGPDVPATMLVCSIACLLGGAVAALSVRCLRAARAGRRPGAD